MVYGKDFWYGRNTISVIMAGIYLDFAFGFNLPPYWKNHPVGIERIGDNITQKEAEGRLYQDSLSIRWEEESDDNWWQFPFDPVISISGKNTIIRRNVLKMDNNVENRRGTIKELWSQDDYAIQIAGVFMGKNAAFPEADIKTLKRNTNILKYE